MTEGKSIPKSVDDFALTLELLEALSEDCLRIHGPQPTGRGIEDLEDRLFDLATVCREMIGIMKRDHVALAPLHLVLAEIRAGRLVLPQEKEPAK